MTDYRSNADLSQLAHRIRAAHQVLITTHVKPDGDAMGSCLALSRALSKMRKNPKILLMGPIEANLKSIAGDTQFDHHRETDGTQQIDPGQHDLIIVCDTGAWSQLEPVQQYLRENRERVLGIDHHSRGDDIASMRYIDAQAVSTTAIILPLLRELQCTITGGQWSIAEALFVGLATDSGWFRYNNAGPEAFAMASQLLEYGVNKAHLYQMLEENFGPERLALESRALASLEYVPLNGSRSRAQIPLHPTDVRDNHDDIPLAAIQSLRDDDFKAAGASIEDVTGLVNTPMSVGAVRVSILLTQTTPGLTKVSFRSKAAAPNAHPNEFVDVNALANAFGGGGHVHAAGARIPKDLDEAKRAVSEKLLGLKIQTTNQSGEGR